MWLSATRRWSVVAIALGVIAACGSDAAPVDSAPTSSVSSGVSEAVSASSSSTTVVTGIENVWVGTPADETALPIGTSHVSTTGPAVGDLFVCAAGNANGGGAFAAGPWIDEGAGTWDATAKVSVQGTVSWPSATVDESVDGTTRTIRANGLPVGTTTGVFPIASTDPAHDHDRNPNAIAAHQTVLTLPVAPVVADPATCLPKGAVGITVNGVALFAPVDELNRDAVAYEIQDACDGHPEQRDTYHFHSVSSCLMDAATGPSTVIGYADDGFPIVVERDASGALPTNADLDECHGRTSPIVVDGELVDRYHYAATAEFPYFIGCFRGTPV